MTNEIFQKSTHEIRSCKRIFMKVVFVTCTFHEQSVLISQVLSLVVKAMTRVLQS